jgi:hypothetical protein
MSVLRAWFLGASLLAAGVAAVVACGSNGGSSFDDVNGDGGGATDGGPGTGFGDGGGFGGGDGAATVSKLVFDPPTVTLTLDGINPQTAQFTLKATFPDGTVGTVTPQSVQFDRPDIASMMPGSPVALIAAGDAAGTGTLQGVYGGHVASAKLTVVVHARDVGPGVDPTAAAALDGASLAKDPIVTSLLYPYDKTIFPLGLTSPLLMWTAPNASDTYKIHLEEAGYSSDTYAIPSKSGQLRVSQNTWDRLTASNTGDAVKATLSRYDVASKTPYASTSETWTIAPASLRGAIYYWTTSTGGHMSRIRPGTGAAPEQLAGGQCMGCHAVSADGTTMVAAVENEGATDNTDQRGWVSYNLPDAGIRKEPKLFGGNVAVNPDGKYTVFGTAPLKVADTATGTETLVNGLESFALDMGMTTLAHPAFSPDGKKFAAVESSNNWYTWQASKLVLFSFDEGTVKFTSPTPLAASASFGVGQQAIAYPSFSPDSAFIAFHVGDHASGCSASCDNNETGISAIYLQATSGAAPVRLAQLTDSPPNAPDRNLSFEPTFNPIERGGYFWVVFTSMRDWGNEITGTPNNGKKRLWVTAIDKTAGTADPSHPAFFLEGQEETTTNMRGFWALAACTQTPMPGAGGGSCAAGFECCSGFCDKGACVDKGTLACAAQGDSCKVDADCCNSPLVGCKNGSCQAAGPK